jgi:1,4-dihydroxy-2-naphthoyl-CoA hydrolase
VSHVGLVLGSIAGVRMADGRELVLRPGELFAIPPGHDSWVIWEEAYVSLHLLGADAYAAPGFATEGSAEPDLTGSTELMRLIGLRFDQLGKAEVSGHLDASAAHHHPWRKVHGGVYATVIEAASTTGAYLAVRDHGQIAVGITNASHFLRAQERGRWLVQARALHQGRSGQVWTVEITSANDGRRVAVGDVRLQHLSYAGDPADSRSDARER